MTQGASFSERRGRFSEFLFNEARVDEVGTFRRKVTVFFLFGALLTEAIRVLRSFLAGALPFKSSAAFFSSTLASFFLPVTL